MANIRQFIGRYEQKLDQTSVVSIIVKPEWQNKEIQEYFGKHGEDFSGAFLYKCEY